MVNFLAACVVLILLQVFARDCPTGNRLRDIATDFDTAHAIAECSGQGTCDRKTGLCECDATFGGPNCGRLICPISCSQHGTCISLSQAASINDGYIYNRSTVYNLWDSKVIYGCKCDYGKNLKIPNILFK